MGHLISIGMLPPFPDCITSVCFLLLATAFYLAARCRRIGGGGGTRRGLSIQVTDRAVARRALLEHSSAFLDRPHGVVPSSILTGGRHCNIHAAPYGPYWRAARRNIAGVLHPSGLGRHGETRARALGHLVRELRSGAPADEALRFAVYSVLAEMCFGTDVVSGLGETRLRAMLKLQRDVLLAIPSFVVLLRYPRIGKLLYPSRWRQVLAFRREQDETFLPLVAAVKGTTEAQSIENKTYVETLVELRVREDGGRALTDGEFVSLISEFLGAGTETTAAALQWAMANLVKRPDLQQELRAEVVAVSGNAGIIEEAELSRMPYLRAFVLESLRRHPPIPFVIRHVEREVAAKVLGVRAPDRGATVNFLVGKIGRDAAAWSDPAEFKPERFMDGGNGNGNGKGKDADLTCTRDIRMMPFGVGRRACPAIAPAMLHLEYFIANLVREFEWWEADGGDENAVDLTEFHGAFVTIMKRPLRARLVDRQA